MSAISEHLSGRAGSETAERLLQSRHRDRDYALRRVLLAGDWMALLIATAASFAIVGRRHNPIEDALWIMLTLPFWAILLRAYGLYERPVRRFEPTHLDDTSSLAHSLIIGTLGLWLFYRLMPVPRMSFEEVVGFGVLALLLTAATRVAVRRVNLSLRGPERVLVIAPMDQVRVIRRKLQNHPEYAMAVSVAMPVGDDRAGPLGIPVCRSMDELHRLVAAHEVDHVVVQLNHDVISQEALGDLMRACGLARVRFGTFTRERALITPGVEVNHIEGTGFLSYHPPVLSRTSRISKRSLDVVGSALLLGLFALPMGVIALAIKLDDGGDVLYRQRRVGRDGVRFQLLKFRTMVPEADALVEGLMAESLDPDWLVMEDDPRVTRVGGFLRRSSLDELPQLWNVLRGDMSLVGPRPLSERDDAEVRGWGRHRLDCVPGVTGYWQVLGRNSIPFREMVEIDYAYVSSWTFWADIKLLIRTIPVVLTRRGSN